MPTMLPTRMPRICFVCCFACRQPCRLAHASLPMNKSAISPEALNRFRVAASQYTHTAKSRASRLLTLKDDIAALRKRGISYRAISELLTQNGIPASDTCVTNFCHRVLKENARAQVIRQAPCFTSCQPCCFAKKRAGCPGQSHVAARAGHTPARPHRPAETSAFTSRGPRIAKVELLPPGETI